jgi:hypothetical protein
LLRSSIQKTMLKMGTNQRKVDPKIVMSWRILFWLTSKSTQPYQRGRASITGLRLKLRESM